MSDTLLHIARLSLAFGRVNRATLHEDGTTPESDTDHTVMLGLLAIDVAFGHPELDLNIHRLSTLALVHDLAEAYAGDTNTAGGLTPEQKADKEAREAAAIARIRAEFGATSPIVLAIEMYEADRCPEARFLRYLDKITPKLTHALNGGAAIRRMGHDVAWLREAHRKQGAALATKYPEFASVLGPLFDAACAASEEALAGPPPASMLTNCNRCRWAGEHGGHPTCAIGRTVACLPSEHMRLAEWRIANLDHRGHPRFGATGCPSFKPADGV